MEQEADRASEESYLEDAILDKVSRRMELAALREWSPDVQNSKVRMSQLDPIAAEGYKRDIQLFVDDLRRLLVWDLLPETPEDWIYTNDAGDQILKYSHKDFKIRVRRWDVSILYRKKVEVPEAKLGVLHELLSKVMIPKLVDQDQKDLPPVKEERFNRFSGEMYATYRSRGRLIGDRFSGLEAYFDGKILLIALWPELLRRIETDRQAKNTKAIMQALRKQRG